MTCRSCHQTGFTLIEMIIALVLAGLLAVVVFSGLHLGIRSWEAVIKHQRSGSDAYVTQHAIRRILGSVRLEWVEDVDGVQQAAFYGTSDKMVFVAPFGQGDSPEQLYWVMLGVQQDETGRESLVLHHRVFASDDGDDGGQAPKDRDNLDWKQQINEMRLADPGIVIHDGPLEGFLLEYLRVEKGQESIWETEWQDDAQLPGLIRMRFTEEPGGHWPELLVMPKVNGYEIKDLL